MAIVNGTGGDDVSLTGTTAADTIDGGAGADSMIGLAGNDLYIVDNVGDTVTEVAAEGTDTIESSVTYTLDANVEILKLTGATDINANGNADPNSLFGKTSTGANVLTGGLGNDNYYIDSTDTVVESAGEGFDIVYASFSYTMDANIEQVILQGTADINATGNNLNHYLSGFVNTGANILSGGLGGDVYFVRTNDTVVEASGEGTDTVFAYRYDNLSPATYTLSANVEHMFLFGTVELNGTGNALNNQITGSANNNVIDGGAGADVMVGKAGDDSASCHHNFRKLRVLIEDC